MCTRFPSHLQLSTCTPILCMGDHMSNYFIISMDRHLSCVISTLEHSHVQQQAVFPIPTGSLCAILFLLYHSVMIFSLHMSSSVSIGKSFNSFTQLFQDLARLLFM